MQTTYDEEIRLLVDGEWTLGTSGKSSDLYNPATGEVIGSVPHASTGDLDHALDATAKAFKVWKNTTPAERGAILNRAAELMEKDIDRIARILTMEGGKTLSESKWELTFAIESLRWYAEEGRRAYGRVVPGRILSHRQLVLKEPVGPSAAFAAWNYPSSNVIRKIGGGLAAGCSIILKPAEETPGTAIAMARCFIKAGLPAGVLQIVFGVPAEISNYLLASPVIKKISFTGSTAVGKLLQTQAAQTLKRCTLELGGHAPAIVNHDADLEKSVATLATLKFRNAGQACVSPTRFYVHENVYNEVVRLFSERASKLRVGSGLEDGIEMGPMIAQRQRERIHGMVEDAIGKGSSLALGGRPMDGKGYFFQPTVISDLAPDARIQTEEPFAPVASFMPFRTVDEAIERANATSYGLGSFVFTRDAEFAHRCEAELEVGMVGVNNTMLSTPETPFGGINESGYGHEGGIEGVDAYQRTKTVSELFY
ncbi:NAD-dependent succinate-semialdehyde dehydrogenase [Mesorhizobium sp.]|uniref:NAD-dependent succinate-semialdehyde dehydrogenase n=1 Tax=Mesorhizobium sp. TaxID=1871066 RepID=UPI000FE880B6|nr:NAD-dependent succinate-semialdehyde dehydrogenase [Mesorhizobium sp.]RWJ05737.1 MAG: NAD-dependent succinate-semialdehyde dehydrogenase [Mesorhizobium sp.]